MKLTYVPLVRIQREIYDLPRGRERFQQYLRTMRDDEGNGLDLPPLVLMNPMAREHVPAMLDQLLAIDADRLAARAVSDAAGDLAEAPGDFKIGLVIADDLRGGWTNRYASEIRVRFPRMRTSPAAWSTHAWLTTVFWSSEVVSATAVREAVLTAIYRVVYTQRHGRASTLRDMLAQEGWVLSKSGCRGPVLDEEDLSYTRAVLADYLDADDMRTAIECLFGDVAARSLGLTPRGLSPWAGLAMALHDAQLANVTPP